ncbi:hypothetical protein Goklo_006415 [Gossypium klotzschianum]|uniref:Uncharacterized protein n=1 Tax=Gossypium klotzschianum TaxID=34286 RepID=A0A7J8VHH4_9ROSI|nr:hypothetical protein [Gossypium klotzschianum]
MWMQLIYTFTSPLLNTNTVNVFRAALLYCILQRKRASFRKWVNKEICVCASDIKFGIYFPHLIIDLSLCARVVMGCMEQFHHPTTSIIGDNLMHQFQELNRKHIQEWNHQRKQKMEMPTAPLKRSMKAKEEDEETGDEATEDNNFKSYKGNFKSSFASTMQPRVGLVFRELSD